jgi:DNA repair exonuclease SbcCD ATPase subunit
MDLNEIEKIVTECDYRYCSLWKDGEKIETWNKSGNGITKFKVIKKRLLSQPAGLYVVKCQNSMSGPADEFEYEKTDGEKDKTATISEKINPKFLENKAYMELAIKNAELLKDQEIATLKDIIRNLKAEIEELKDQIEELETVEETMLNEPAQSNDFFESSQGKFITTLLEHTAPLVDQYFSTQNRKLDLEERRLNMMRRPAAAAQQPQPGQNPNQENELAVKIAAWVDTKVDQEEVFEALKYFYQTSQNVAQFYEKVNNYNNDLYNELRAEIGQ